MKTRLITSMTIAIILIAYASTTFAQGSTGDIYWRIDRSVKDCSMIIDPSLTQAQWHDFTKQLGALGSFKSLASAKTLGTLNFRVGLDYANTPVDQRNLAWINTFTHPDEDCPLGDAIVIPTLRASVGIAEDMDIGAYLTSAPDANYGMIGGEFKYQFSQESEDLPAAAVRASATILTGVSDFDLYIYSAEVMASKTFAMFTPYVGFRGSLAIGKETTSKVNLATERVLIPQGYAGVSCSVWLFNAAVEYNVSAVNTVAFAVGVNF